MAALKYFVGILILTLWTGHAHAIIGGLPMERGTSDVELIGTNKDTITKCSAVRTGANTFYTAKHCFKTDGTFYAIRLANTDVPIFTPALDPFFDFAHFKITADSQSMLIAKKLRQTDLQTVLKNSDVKYYVRGYGSSDSSWRQLHKIEVSLQQFNIAERRIVFTLPDESELEMGDSGGGIYATYGRDEYLVAIASRMGVSKGRFTAIGHLVSQ